jgi:hypothetical protein
VLHCPAATGRCKGTVTLVAEIPVVSVRGKRHVRRLVPITLAYARFGLAKLAKGDFTIIVQLNRNAETHLRLHHGRLTLQVGVSSRGTEDRTRATLTQSAQPSNGVQGTRR